jgi:hypothetical protein
VIAGSIALAFFMSGAPLLGQAPNQDRQPPRQQPVEPAPISGELVDVDTVGKMITVKPQDGAEVKFGYNDATEVSGAKDGAAGLATLKEGRVTVHFKEDAQTKTKLATRIIVEPRK